MSSRGCAAAPARGPRGARRRRLCPALEPRLTRGVQAAGPKKQTLQYINGYAVPLEVGAPGGGQAPPQMPPGGYQPPAVPAPSALPMSVQPGWLVNDKKARRARRPPRAPPNAPPVHRPRAAMHAPAAECTAPCLR
jgi:hypothetical protein